MTDDEARRAAEIHAEAMPPGGAWSAADVASFASSPGAVVLLGPDAVLLGRVAADEAEIVALAVRPSARRRGLGRQLVEEFLRASQSSGVKVAFLEVAEDAHDAKRLYAATGWTEIGRRPKYYRRLDGTRIDAILLTHGMSRKHAVR